ENGINVETVKQIKEVNNDRISSYLQFHPEAKYFDGCSGIWSIPCDVALPCATQNEIDQDSANQLLDNGVEIVAEGANMPATAGALRVVESDQVLSAPAKAASAGGVAVSSLEMAQNSMRIACSFEEGDQKVHESMKNIYDNCVTAAKDYGQEGHLIA